MRSALAASFAILLLAAAIPTAQQRSPAKGLTIYHIDTEGGQATLFVAPSGESLLVDSGNPGGRDTDRIQLAMADAGVTQLDHLLSTHYHTLPRTGLKYLRRPTAPLP
jgi:beta-lactamase superfamily II metal-dependent hydrolase